MCSLSLQVNMVSGYDIYGAFQPDTIKSFKGKDGKDYMITANEGDAKVPMQLVYCLQPLLPLCCMVIPMAVGDAVSLGVNCS